MRCLVIAATFAASLASLTALKASAAAGTVAHRMKTYTLGCEVMRAGFFDVRNNAGRTIPKGTPIELVIVVAGNRTLRVKKTVSTKLPFSAGLYHAFAPVPQGAQSCSASVKLLPNYLRR